MEQMVTLDEGSARREHRLGVFVLDMDRGELRSADRQLVALRKQALEVLLVLGAQSGHVVSKAELLRSVWPNVVVGDDSLVQAIAEIRRVLSDGGHRLVRTVARRGYMLVPEAAVGPPSTPHSGNVAGLPVRRQRWAWVAVAVVIAAFVAGSIALSPPSAVNSVKPMPVSVPTRSLVVLPLRSEAGASDQEWFAEALTGDLTSILAASPDVFVIGRGTALRYKDKSIDPRGVARELGVRYVIHGAVRRDGDQVRLDLAMVDGETGAQSWGEQFNIERARLSQSIDDIKGGLARTLFIELGKSVGQRIEKMKPDQVAADDLAMQGFAVFLRSVSQDNFAEAGRLFERAVAKDPNSERGLAGVSLTNSMGVIFQWLPDRDAAARRAEETLTRLESIDANGYNTLAARASLTNMRADWEGLLTVAGTMLAYYPADATSHHHRCSALLRLGRHEDSIQACERAIRISPRDSRVALWHGLIGMNHYMEARYALAAEEARHPVTGIPNLPFYWLLLAASLAQDGREDEARQVLKDFKARYPAFDLAAVQTLWPATHPKFVAGRDRIMATVREMGLR